MVIHAGIDGFSRLPVYCHCSNNNRAETVLSLFMEAVEMYGLPSRVRCGENTQVGMYMLTHPLRGTDRGSIICGRSQRVERYWRDLFSGCTSLFYDLFYHLEDAGILDIYTFGAYIYLPLINYSLSNFTAAWSNHPMSSMRGMSPLA